MKFWNKIYLSLIHYITLNLNISASRQNIKNLGGNFESLNVGNIHAKFQPLSFTGMGGGGGDRWTDTWCHACSLYKISNAALALLGKG